MIIFAISPLDDEAIQIAKDWIMFKAYSRDDVRLFKTENCVCVELKDGKTIRD